MGAEVTLHPQAIAVRIEIPETGWATSTALLTALGELGVRYVALDEGGVRAVALPTDVAKWTARFGELSRGLHELATVELRDDVALLVGRSTDAGERLREMQASLQRADVPLRGAFAGGADIGLLVDRWHADAAKAALSA